MHYLYIYQKYYDMMFFLIQTEKVKISKYQIVFPPETPVPTVSIGSVFLSSVCVLIHTHTYI